MFIVDLVGHDCALDHIQVVLDPDQDLLGRNDQVGLTNRRVSALAALRVVVALATPCIIRKSLRTSLSRS